MRVCWYETTPADPLIFGVLSEDNNAAEGDDHIFIPVRIRHHTLCKGEQASFGLV